MSVRVNRFVRLVLIAFAVVSVAALLADSALAQCVMCRASVGANASFVRHLNIGTLVLLIPPVSMFCVIFVVAFLHRKSG